MGYRTTVANSDTLSNTTFGGITPAYPFTVAGWWCPLVLGVDYDLWTVTRSSGALNYWYIYKTGTSPSADKITIGATNNDIQAGTACVVSMWYFFVGRFISATNRRLTVLHPTGLIENVQNITSNTPTGFNSENISCEVTTAPKFTTAISAEYWRTNTDIQLGGAALNNDLLLQLAYKGPWSVSAVAEKIVWYRSLLKASGDTTDTIDDPAFARNGRVGWTRAGTTSQPAPHPPLAADYVYLNTLKPRLMSV